MERLSDEELLNQVKERLEEHSRTIEEYKSLSDQLKAINLKLEESEALKSHFISNITNELMNPFASIMALSREILELRNKADWDKVEMMVNLIHTETFYLDFQLRNIFAAARIEAGEALPEISQFNIEHLINNTIELFDIEAKKHSVDIKVQIGIPEERIEFKSDPAKVKLIIINFISNAIKFSKIGSEIELKVSLSDAGELVIEVVDNGSGIAPEFKEEIYDRFKKKDTTINSVVRGNGLGLSINKAYVELLDGTISFESEIGEGTTFRVFLPESTNNINSYSDGGNDFFFDDEFII